MDFFEWFNAHGSWFFSDFLGLFLPALCGFLRCFDLGGGASCFAYLRVAGPGSVLMTRPRQMSGIANEPGWMSDWAELLFGAFPLAYGTIPQGALWAHLSA